MLTTGEIRQVTIDKNNKLCYRVRLPLFETPGQTTPFIVPCYVCYAPGNINNYIVGDRVFVDFLSGKYNTPIIMGKIYKGAETQATNSSFDSTLIVTDSAILPANTKIGNLAVEDLINIKNEIELLNKRIDYILNERVYNVYSSNTSDNDNNN